jgi:ribokinase
VRRHLRHFSISKAKILNTGITLIGVMMKILNFGSLNIDYVYHVDHFVRPGETILSNNLEVFCGGKGLNQSIAISRAGVSVFHAGNIGKDGEILKDCLEKSGVDITFLRKSDKLSGHAIIQVDKSGQNCIILHSGANYDTNEDFIDEVLCNFEKGDIVLLQNEINNIQYIMKKAYQKGLKIAFNPSPINKDIVNYPLQYVDWFILNEIEGNELSSKIVEEDIADKLLDKYPSCAVVLTLGKKGVCYKDNKQIVSHGIYDVKVEDTTAAGDTFTGYFLAGIIKELEVNEILRQASIASSISVSRMGASESIPVLDDVLNFLKVI